MQQKTLTQTSTLKSRTTNVRIVIMVVVLLAAAAGAFFYHQQSENATKVKELKKNVVIVKRGPAKLSVIATGLIKPVREVKLSPKQSGLLKELFVKQGDYVKAGQVIAVMDDSNLRGQVESAKGAYLASLATADKMSHGNRPQEVAAARYQQLKAERAVLQAREGISRLQAQQEALKAQLTRDESYAKRQGLLAVQGAVSEQAKIDAETAAMITRSQLEAAEREREQALQAMEQTQAELQVIKEQYNLMHSGFRQEEVQAARHNSEQSKGQLQYSQSLLNDTIIRAPFSGVITQKYTDAGAIVTPTTSAATTSATSSSIVALSGKLELVAQVAESNIPKITIGLPVEITATAYPDRTFKGRVTQIAPAAIVTQNVTTFEVHADLTDNQKNELLSGMNVSAKFIVGTVDDAITIPTVCVVTRRGKTGVYVPGEGGEPDFKPVKTGQTLGRDIIILEGLKENEEVFEGLSRDQMNKEGFEGRRGGGFMGGGGGGGGRGMGRGFR